MMKRATRLLAGGILALLSGAAALAQAPDAANATVPQVRLLATGGTIAGAGNEAAASYKSGVVPVSGLIAALPGVEKIATISGEQIANIASGDMDEGVWRQLLARVAAAQADPAVAGVVITHGTDTLEETAFLLSLLVPASKPVVVVGSMRPSTAVSADGPQNLMDAVRVAAAPNAAGRGVMVVMNDTIFDPTSVTKMDMARVNAFAAPARGPIGHVLLPTPRFFAPAAAPAAAPLVAPLALLDAKLPRIAVVYAYAGITGDEVRQIAKGAAGVIMAGVGAGGFSTSAREAVRELTKRGVPVVRTPRQGQGDIRPALARADREDDIGTIGGRELTPAKARILLMLALQQKRTRDELQALFDSVGGPVN
jgi:L-asparaginase